MERTSIASLVFVLSSAATMTAVKISTSFASRTVTPRREALAGAEGKGILGRDNAQFARKLFEANLPDLAENMCKAIETSGGSTLELLEISALRFELALAAVRRQNDLDERMLGLKKIIADEGAFIKENARTSVADVVRSNLPTVYLELASTLTAMLTREKDVQKRSELIQEGQRTFAEAKKTLEERVARFKDQLDQGVGDQSYAERQHLVALFNLARMNYQSAQLSSAGSLEHKVLIEAALQGFQDVGFDYEESEENYKGIIFQGLCHEALGLPDEALVDYEDAVALREQFVLDPQGMYEVGPLEGDLISGATLQRVELLTRLKRTREAIAAAADFLATIPDALLCTSGPKILKAKAEAEIAAGDIAEASLTAEMLVNSDPQGWGGSTGRGILAQLPVFGLAPDKILKIADTASMRGDFSRALDLCRRARESVRGARDEHELGAAALFLTGRIYMNQGRLHEASVAYDCAAELYKDGSKAPEALNAAVNAYRELAKRDRSRFYNKRADERMNTLATRYPKHQLAANAGIWNGLKREDEGDFAGAIEFYSKVEPNSASFQEASFRLANATYQAAQALLQQDKKAEAEPLMQQAEERYKAALTLLAKAQEDTLDSAVQQRLGNFIFSAKVGLGSLLIDVKKPTQVLPLLEGLEGKVNGDPEMVAAVWSLRIRALQADGKVDQAVALFESLLQSSPNAPGIASAAGVLARALDQAAVTLAEKEPKSKRVEELWQRAAFYYSLSVQGALLGTTVLRSDDVSVIAQRLYIIGLFFNQVPEGQNTFVDWQGTVLDPSLWERAAEIYARLDAQAPSYRISIERARTLAILGRIGEAEVIYSKLFDQVSLFTPGSKVFDRGTIDANPELVSAYLEWGVTEHVVGLEAKDQRRLDRAAEIYVRTFSNFNESARPWWQAKYFQVKLYMDRGVYEDADAALRNVKRGSDPQYDKGQFGFKDRMLAMEGELSKKVFRTNVPAPTEKKAEKK